MDWHGGRSGTTAHARVTRAAVHCLVRAEETRLNALFLFFYFFQLFLFSRHSDGGPSFSDTVCKHPGHRQPPGANQKASAVGIYAFGDLLLVPKAFAVPRPDPGGYIDAAGDLARIRRGRRRSYVDLTPARHAGRQFPPSIFRREQICTDVAGCFWRAEDSSCGDDDERCYECGRNLVPRRCSMVQAMAEGGQWDGGQGGLG